ncbi:hypothetical protein Glove_51g60 [Diversispora epigaea]|uniref:BTB domain-containing protein n=1 Tax=Diversispora epigaea TaxID=1348612 RepID=A0A397JPL0_9GLOM|nr:hypothetical protein Glove_51g60 [Diversispora epigaea]
MSTTLPRHFHTPSQKLFSTEPTKLLMEKSKLFRLNGAIECVPTYQEHSSTLPPFATHKFALDSTLHNLILLEHQFLRDILVTHHAIISLQYKYHTNKIFMKLKKDLQDKFIIEISKLYKFENDFNVNIFVGVEPNIKVFKAHSLVLRARSSYFRAALSKNWAIKTKDNFYTLKKPNISPDIFEPILKYIYTGDIYLYGNERLIDLLLASDELALVELAEYIQFRVTCVGDAWTKRHIVQLFNFMSSHDENVFNILLKYLMNDIIAHETKLLFDSEDLKNLEEEIMLRILKQDYIQLEEIEIWEYCLKWGISQLPYLDEEHSKWSFGDYMDLEKILHRCIPLIRFFNMKPGDYFDKIKPYEKLLPKELLEDLQLYYTVPNHDKPQKSIILSPRKHLIAGSNILESMHATLISGWIDRKDYSNIESLTNVYEFELLLRGSDNGFGPLEFRKRCFYQDRTVIVIKLANSNQIIGGYNPLEWEGSKFYKYTKDSFIFSIPEEIKKSKISRPCCKERAIADDMGWKIGFGKGDLQIFLKECKQKDYEFSIFQGEFEIEEYEVFRIETK